MNVPSAIQHNVALVSMTVSGAAASVAWMDTIDRLMRMGSSGVAIATGIAALVFYGKQNGWWK